jgi:hypothetical protein
MTWYIVLLHDTIGYIVECHVVTVKEFLSLAGKFVPTYHANSDTNTTIFVSNKMPKFFENVSTDVKFDD